jgi:hypothetical protein
MDPSDRAAEPASGPGDGPGDGPSARTSGLKTLAERHGVSLDAVRHLLQALERGHGTMAQFDHPDLGGMGQWFSGGMVMVGRMFDDALGHPASTGSQNGLRYAYFPESRRLAVETGSGVALYDTGAHRITGVSQANGSLGFTGPTGSVDLDRLARIEAETAAPRQADPARAPAPEAASGPDLSAADAVLATLERLADLHARGVLTDREFSDKKAELLARL